MNSEETKVFMQDLHGMKRIVAIAAVDDNIQIILVDGNNDKCMLIKVADGWHGPSYDEIKDQLGEPRTAEDWAKD